MEIIDELEIIFWGNDEWKYMKTIYWDWVDLEEKKAIFQENWRGGDDGESDRKNERSNEKCWKWLNIYIYIYNKTIEE